MIFFLNWNMKSERASQAKGLRRFFQPVEAAQGV